MWPLVNICYQALKVNLVHIQQYDMNSSHIVRLFKRRYCKAYETRLKQWPRQIKALFAWLYRVLSSELTIYIIALYSQKVVLNVNYTDTLKRKSKYSYILSVWLQFGVILTVDHITSIFRDFFLHCFSSYRIILLGYLCSFSQDFLAV